MAGQKFCGDIIRMIHAGVPPGSEELIDYLDEQTLFKAREYLIRAHQLLMSDQLEERIWRIERVIEEQVDF